MDDLIKLCKDSGLRITVGLRTILTVLNEAKLPLSLHELETHESLMKNFDRTTIFRTLQRLEGIGMLRRLNFSHSGAKFTLNKGHNHKEYLICKSCGEVQALEISCPVHKLEKELSETKGFTNMSHELTFYGLCETCG